MTKIKLLRSRVNRKVQAWLCRPAGWVTALLSLTDVATYSSLPDKTISGGDSKDEFNELSGYRENDALSGH